MQRSWHKVWICIVLMSFILPLVLCGCGPKKDTNLPLGTIYYSGPKVPKSANQSQKTPLQTQ